MGSCQCSHRSQPTRALCLWLMPLFPKPSFYLWLVVFKMKSRSQLSMCWWLGGLGPQKAHLTPLSDRLSAPTLPLPGTSGHAQPPLFLPLSTQSVDVLHATFGQAMHSRVASGLAAPSAVSRWSGSKPPTHPWPGYWVYQGVEVTIPLGSLVEARLSSPTWV